LENGNTQSATEKPKSRIFSIDAFRGFTVLAMIFVNQVAQYKHLPFEGYYFGSTLVSLFHHAGEAEGNTLGIGLTLTDLVAPFFVFIVGMVIPFSLKGRREHWFKHVLGRTGLLWFLGVIYISLILGLSYWWGILQAIGIAYLMGATFVFLPKWARWISVFAIAGFHLLMSQMFPWWLHLGNPQMPFFSIANLHGDMLRPLTVHCTPWASISFGVITIVGTLLGEAVMTKKLNVIIRDSLIIGIAFCAAGFALHSYYFPYFAMAKDTVSASYALFTSGVASLTFLAFYLIMDVAKIKTWAYPFIVFGSNALLGYFLQVIVRLVLFALGFKQYFAGHEGWDGMLWGIIWTAIIWATLWCCNKKNIYWKI
jgi:predicted acyltransferase